MGMKYVAAYLMAVGGASVKSNFGLPLRRRVQKDLVKDWR